MDAAQRDGREATDGAAAAARHQRFLRTARAIGPAAGPQELLATVVEGLFDLDPSAGDRASLSLTAGATLDVVAALPGAGPRTSSDAARRVVQEGEPTVVRDDAGAEIAVPLVVEGGQRGALVIRRPHGHPLPEVETVELATVLLAHADSTLRWLDAQHQLEVARADFVARVSHELRTPLAIISGFASILGSQGEDLSDEQRDAMLDRIVTASVRLEHLVEELLTLASVQLGHRTPEPLPCVVRDVLDLVVRDQGGGDRVVVDCPADLRVVTDPVLARLVIGPVVENALDHGEQVHLTAERTTDGIRVVVHDDGPGVPDDLGDRIFERFVRGDDQRPGFGLGLATAAQIGQVIGARLSLEESASGARIRIELPALTTEAIA